MKNLIISFFFLFLGLGTSAQSIGLDAAFGDNGIAIADFVNIRESPLFIGQQTDGKLMVGGCYDIPFQGGQDTFMIVRLHENGELDTTYGTAGLANLTETGSSTGMAVQADNKTIIVGSYTSDDNFRAIRLDEAGNLDPSFGDNGKVVLSFGSNLAICKGVLPLADGRILLVGDFFVNANNRWPMLVQLLADGSLDADFGNNGVAYFPEASSTRSQVEDIKVLPDGKILLAGAREAFTSGPIGWTLWRFLPNGTIDTTYGEDGAVSTVMGTQNGFDEKITQIVVQTDGAVIVKGFFPSELGVGFVLARYHDDGTLNLDFGDEGLLVPYFPTLAVLRLNSITIQPDQKILVSGSGSLEGDETAGTGNLQFFRFLPDGTPDPDFDDNGLYTAAAVDLNYSTAAMILTEEDRAVVVGRAVPGVDITRTKIFAARLYYGPEIVAVSAPATKEAWLLAPNPCQDVLRISAVESNAPPIIRLRLFNSMGQLALTASGEYLSEVSIGHLLAGSYWLEMTDKQGGVFREEIVKMK